MNQPSRLQPKYKFYATLLDSFTWYLNSEKDEAFQEFIDKLNRVPFESEAAAKGTAFNELIDALVEGNHIEPIDGVFIHDGFAFKESIVMEFAEYFAEAIPQYRAEAILQTRYGNVLLYGYVDEIKGAAAFDIKTTKRYEFPKFVHNWQHRVYPYCLREEGAPVEVFEYTVTDFNNIYQEAYVPNHTKDKKDLQLICERLIDFIEQHRNLITDLKLFALDKEVEA